MKTDVSLTIKKEHEINSASSRNVSSRQNREKKNICTFRKTSIFPAAAVAFLFLWFGRMGYRSRDPRGTNEGGDFHCGSTNRRRQPGGGNRDQQFVPRRHGRMAATNQKPGKSAGRHGDRRPLPYRAQAVDVAIANPSIAQSIDERRRRDPPRWKVIETSWTRRTRTKKKKKKKKSIHRRSPRWVCSDLEQERREGSIASITLTELISPSDLT